MTDREPRGGFGSEFLEGISDKTTKGLGIVARWAMSTGSRGLEELKDRAGDIPDFVGNMLGDRGQDPDEDEESTPKD